MLKTFGLKDKAKLNLMFRALLLWFAGFVLWSGLGALLFLHVQNHGGYSQQVVIYIVVLSVIMYTALLVSFYLMLVDFVGRPSLKLVDNKSWLSWICAVFCYGAFLAINYSVEFDPVETHIYSLGLTSFIIALNRLSLKYAVIFMLGGAIGLGFRVEPAYAIGIVFYSLIQQIIFWLLIKSAINDVRAHNRLTSEHSKLRATQDLLESSIKQNERLRISRDLHDQVGHHLAALSVNLQVAEKLADEEQLKHILAQARDTTKEMFADVRDVVYQLRNDSSISVYDALMELAGSVPYLETTLICDSHLQVDSLAQAECILRCVQESLTNTIKHSDATHIEIQLYKQDDGLHLEIKDNGRNGVGVGPDGNGLMGMQERISILKGMLTVGQSSHGFVVQVKFPLGNDSAGELV